MTIWKMFTVGIKNCARNWKISLLFGVLLGLGLSLISSAPSTILEFVKQNSKMHSAMILLPFISVLSLAVAVLQPTLTTLPLLTAYTRPPQNGPQSFKGRFSKKFGPFLLLSLIWLAISAAVTIIWVILFVICALIAGIFSLSYYSFEPAFLVFLLILIIPLYFAILVISAASYYSYIALTTENIKATQAFAQGFKMLSKHIGRSIGNSLAFSLMAGTIPGILVCLAYFLTIYEFSFSRVIPGVFVGLLLLWLVSLILAQASQTVYTAAMVELYHKNWLEDHNNPFSAPVQATPNYFQNVSPTPENWNTSSQPLAGAASPAEVPSFDGPVSNQEPVSTPSPDGEATPSAPAVDIPDPSEEAPSVETKPSPLPDEAVFSVSEDNSSENSDDDSANL